MFTCSKNLVVFFGQKPNNEYPVQTKIPTFVEENEGFIVA